MTAASRKSAKRKGLSIKARFEIFKRDGFVCQYCGGHPPAIVLHVDHITPIASGGSNDPDNLITACDTCNLGKGARSLEAVPQSLESRAAGVAEREAQIRGYSEVMEAKRLRIYNEAWDVADVFVANFAAKGIRKDWIESIKVFIEKIGLSESMSAMEIAVARKPFSRDACFRYFCGICWNIVRENPL